MSGSGTHLRVDGLNLTLGNFALRDINLACHKGHHHILLGPSGSGKSSLMKCILGFHKITRGRVYLGGRDITGELPERRRNSRLSIIGISVTQQKIRTIKGNAAQRWAGGRADRAPRAVR